MTTKHDFTVAIVVLEREAHALAAMEKTLNRQLQVFPPDSTDYRGAKQALDNVQTRLSNINVGIKRLQH